MLLNDFDVKGKVINITGSSSGIGMDCAQHFLELGRWFVLMEEIRNA